MTPLFTAARYDVSIPLIASLLVVVFVYCCFCFVCCVVGLCVFVLGVGWSSSVHQCDIIRLWHYEHTKLTTVLASLAIISTASKHLHNDLAKAIKALEQKKMAFVLFCGAVWFFVCWFLFSGDRTALGLWTAYRSMLSFDPPMRE